MTGATKKTEDAAPGAGTTAAPAPAPPPPPPPPSAPPTVPVPSGPLVGAVGQEYVAAVLSSTDPRTALREVASAAGLDDEKEKCAPLLGLLDALGVAR